MKDFDSNRIYQTLGDEFKNIYIVDCEDQCELSNRIEKINSEKLS